jgi:hypothetical protein
MRLRAIGDIVRFVAIETTFRPFAFCFAHRARCAAAIRARPAAEILLPVLFPVPFRAESALFETSKLRRETGAFLFQLIEYRGEISHVGDSSSAH